MSQKSVGSHEFDKLASGADSGISQFKGKLGNKYAMVLAKGLYKQYEDIMSGPAVDVVANGIVKAFGELDKGLPAEKRMTKASAYVTFMNFLKDEKTKPASEVYNRIMDILGAEDPDFYKSLSARLGGHI